MEFEDFVLEVGRKIRDVRVSKGITQQQMATGSYGISHRTVQDIESGRSPASLRSLFLIASRLSIHPKELLEIEKS